MGHANLSLGNAYGSNIFNIAIVLGVAALIRPIRVRPAIIAFAVPLLVGVSFLSCLLVRAGGTFSRLDGLLSLGAFAVQGRQSDYGLRARFGFGHYFGPQILSKNHARRHNTQRGESNRAYRRRAVIFSCKK